MKLYLEFIKIAFRSRTAYRMEAFLLFFGRVLSLFAQIAIWRALLGQTRTTESLAGTISLREMVTYVIVSQCISVFVSLFASYSPLRTLGEKIRTGNIALDLIKPVSLKINLFCETIGNNLFEMVFGLLPMIFLGVFIFGMDFPDPLHFGLFLVAAINGLIIYFLISYIVGLIGFWYLEIWHLERFLNDMVIFFSGALIPLWFFPSILAGISGFFPFRLVYYVPISIYLGREPLTGILYLILQQILWIGILLLIEYFMWSRGTKKLVIQGG